MKKISDKIYQRLWQLENREFWLYGKKNHTGLLVPQPVTNMGAAVESLIFTGVSNIKFGVKSDFQLEWYTNVYGES